MDSNFERSSTEVLSLQLEEVSKQKASSRPLYEYGGGTVEDFERYCWEVHGVRIYHQQRVIAKAYLEMAPPFRRIAVRSGHSVGKTTLLALLLDYEFSCLKNCILSSAPGKEAVKDGIWKEVLNRRQKAQRALPGIFLRTPELRIEDDADWWAKGFFTNEPERAQGKKHPRLRVYLDEASGFPQWFWDAVDSSMSSAHTRMIATGNPIHAKGRFRNIFTDEKSVWITFTISSLHSPCISVAQAWELWEMIREISPELAQECRHQVEEKVEEPWHDGQPPEVVFDGLAAYSWVKEKLIEWAGDLDKIRTRILGLFPSDSKSKVFPDSLIEAAQRFWLEMEEEEDELIDEDKPKIHRASIDPAGDGPDLTVLSFLKGQRIHYAWATNESDTTKQTEMVEEWMESLDADNKPKFISIDYAGVGKGLYDQLLKSRREKPHIWGRTRVIKYWPGTRANDAQQYVYLVDEIHFILADKMKPSTPYAERIGIPPDDRVPYIEKKGEEPQFGGVKSCSITGHFNTRDFAEDEQERKRIDGKKQIEKKQKKSPDLSDSAAGLFISPQMPKIAVLD